MLRSWFASILLIVCSLTNGVEALGSPYDALDGLRQGMPYSEARDHLIGSGWQAPVPLSLRDCSALPQDICDAYPEIIDCSGTGMAPCRAEFRDGRGNLLVITATGEDAASKVLSYWRVEPLKARPSVVTVKYVGDVDITEFDCDFDLESSLVFGYCYNHKQDRLLLDLTGTWYQYCNFDNDALLAFLEAPSKGSHYRRSIRNDATGGAYSC